MLQISAEDEAAVGSNLCSFSIVRFLFQAAAEPTGSAQEILLKKSPLHVASSPNQPLLVDGETVKDL